MISLPWRLLPGIVFLLLISVLFILPGSAFPSQNWMARIHFDKWVHIGFFCVLTLLWSWGLGLYRRRGQRAWLMAAGSYGILVEIVQWKFVANRSFDLWDLVADVVGACVGIGIWNWWQKKKGIGVDKKAMKEIRIR